MTSRGTKDFWEQYHGLPLPIRKAAREAFRKFLENPAHPGLRLERLRSDGRAWSVRITRNYRAVARRYENDGWLWFWVGSHTEFDEIFPK